MRVVTLEEHVAFPEMLELIPEDKHSSPEHSSMMGRMMPKLTDITGERLASMDKNGITVQVLSVVNSGADLLSSEAGPEFAKRYNDTIAGQIKDHQDRFTAFAHLPMTNPEAAAHELERTVNTYGFKGALINGLTNNEFLDDPKYAVIFERAEKLDVPIYLHPGLPPQAVVDAYYSGLPNYSGMLLSIAGWGWHSETAIHVLRLIVSGTFDKFPKLKLIIGHMGEMLPMMMVRCDKAFQPGQAGINQRSVIDTLRKQVYITTSGLFTQPPLTVAIDTFGIDNIMFSVDYPFSTNEQGRIYLDDLDLSIEDKEKLAFKNADRILGLNS